MQLCNSHLSAPELRSTNSDFTVKEDFHRYTSVETLNLNGSRGAGIAFAAIS